MCIYRDVLLNLEEVVEIVSVSTQANSEILFQTDN